jgi:tetratricopeptide (TPR) repeat protein
VLPRQLPPGLTHFAGRAAELAALEGLAAQASGGATGTVIISAIGGTAGVGKTALAVHFAHWAAAAFPDGQLYINLRGFGPSPGPVHPGEALRGFLEALGAQPGQVPAGLDAQAALFRSLLADKRALVILDNAAGEEQVRPLLPGSGRCLAVVTSRRQLTGLAATSGARLITLDVLADDEARDLLADRIGPGRAAAEPAALAELAALCAGLPLALAITAAHAAARPAIPLTPLAAELRTVGSRLDALDADDPAASTRAAFSWSYQALSPPAARMFRLLGIHPGPDISLPAAASLAGLPRGQARATLAELTGASLLTERSPGRYALHDLLRAYAAEQASTCDSEADRVAATGRILGHYLHTAHAAAVLVSPTEDPLTLAPLLPGVTPERLAPGSALAWFEAEHKVISAAITPAADTGLGAHAWQLAWAVSAFLYRRGYWPEWVAALRAGLAAAERLGDAAGQACMHHRLGAANARLGSYQEAHTHLEQAGGMFHQVADCSREAQTHISRGLLCERESHYGEALGHAQQAVELYRAAGHRAGQARALNFDGWCHALLGHYRQAIHRCRQALDLHRELDDPAGMAALLDTLGYAYHHLGRYRAAITCFTRSLPLYRDAHDRYNEADVLGHLGDTHRALGNLRAAANAWRAALAILEDLHHPDAEQARSRLTGLAQAIATGDTAAAPAD